MENNNEKNIFEYIKWRGDLLFSERKINILDLLIFTQVIYIDYLGIVPGIESDSNISLKDAHLRYKNDDNKKAYLGMILPDDIVTLFRIMAKTNRYKDLMLSDYMHIIDYEREEQSTFLTIKIDDNNYVISIAGTDDTIVGWIEDLRLIHKLPVNCDSRAVDYIEKVMDKHPNAKFYLCGHSKGGHEVIYSTLAIKDKYFDRLIASYAFDGPGLNVRLDDKLFDEKRLNKLISIMPEASIVGILFNHKEKIKFAKSMQSGGYQHDAFSWKVNGCDLEYGKEFTNEAISLKCAIDEILDGMTELEKQKFVDSTYKILSFDNVRTLTELVDNKPKLIENYFKVSKEERKYFYKPIQKLIVRIRVIKNFTNTIKGYFFDKKQSKRTGDAKK